MTSPPLRSRLTISAPREKKERIERGGERNKQAPQGYSKPREMTSPQRKKQVGEGYKGYNKTMSKEKQENQSPQKDDVSRENVGEIQHKPQNGGVSDVREYHSYQDNEEWIETALAANKVAKYVADQGNQKENQEWKSTTRKKALFLDIYERTMGTITVACEKADIDRTTYYRWKKNDQNFQKELLRIEESRVDMVEDRVYKLIQQDDGPTIRWFLERTTDKYKSKQVMEHHTDERTFTQVVDKLLDKIKEHGTDA